MKRIFKYTLDPYATSVCLPRGFRILSIQFQGETLQLWAEVPLTEDEDFVPLCFEVVPTGGEPPGPDLIYRATVQYGEGSLVFHVYTE